MKKKEETDKFKEYIDSTNAKVTFVGTIDERISELKEEIDSLRESKKKKTNTHAVIMSDNTGLKIRLEGTKDLERYKTYLDNPFQAKYKIYIDNCKKIFWKNIANQLNNNKNLQWKDICEQYDVREETINNNLKDTDYKKRKSSE